MNGFFHKKTKTKKGKTKKQYQQKVKATTRKRTFIGNCLSTLLIVSAKSRLAPEKNSKTKSGIPWRLGSIAVVIDVAHGNQLLPRANGCLDAAHPEKPWQVCTETEPCPDWAQNNSTTTRTTSCFIGTLYVVQCTSYSHIISDWQLRGWSKASWRPRLHIARPWNLQHEKIPVDAKRTNFEPRFVTAIPFMLKLLHSCGHSDRFTISKRRNTTNSNGPHKS